MTNFTYANAGDTSSTTFVTNGAKIVAKLVRAGQRVSATFTNDLSGDVYEAGKGGVVNVKVPPVLAARKRSLAEKNVGITVDDLVWTTTPLTIGELYYSAVTLSEKNLNQDITDYTTDVLAPQATAIVEQIESDAITHLKTATVLTPAQFTVGATPAAGDVTKLFTKLRKTLVQLGVPTTDLYLAAGAGAYEALLNESGLTDASQSGSTEALREGTIQRLRGFNVLEVPTLNDGEVIAYSKDSVALAIRPPSVVPGQVGSIVRQGDFGIRVVRDYSSTHGVARSFVSTMGGLGWFPTYKASDGTAVATGGARRIANIFS